MDKRTLLFVICLSLTLFFVNLFFQYQNVQRKQQWLSEQQSKEGQKEKRLREEIAQRTASLEALPLVELYAAPSNENSAVDQKPLAMAIFNHGTLLSLSWTSPSPSSVFAKTPDLNEEKEYFLSYEEPSLGSPVLYQARPSERLHIGVLPNAGRYDLQLANVNFDEATTPTVTLGEYTDGHFSLPTPIALHAPHTPSRKFQAIALLKTTQGYLPVALYDPMESHVVLLTEAGNLTPHLHPLIPSSLRSTKKSEEKFYVLENSYQQLVFSNYGGALAEINLPFHTENNLLSVVREIAFDREMVKEHPDNAHFPAHPYYTPPLSPGEGPEFHPRGTLGGYYPLLRRDLVGHSPGQSLRLKPQFYALNIVSEYPELAEMIYEVTAFNDHSITFEAIQHHRRLTKRYFLGDSAHPEGPYCLNLDLTIEGEGRGLWLTSGVPEAEWISGGLAPSLKDRLTRHGKSEVEKIELPQEMTTVTSTHPDWICGSNGFLGMIIDPLKDIDPGYRVQYVSGIAAPSRLIKFEKTNDRFKAANLPGYMTSLPLKSQGGALTFRFFAGPFDTQVLEQVDALYSDPATGSNPDYIACQTMHGWFTFISEPFAKFLFVLMNLFHSVSGSWALSIVLLTISLRLMLYPLNRWSTQSMLRMQQINPEVTAIQEKYKKDPKKVQIEIMHLYRERGVNPASGCLPLLIQMPFLIGMFDLLKSSFALRGVPFIPGWIDDLTAPDVLFSWKAPLFFIGNNFHLLPILLGVVMFLQQRLMATQPKDPHLMTDQQRQQRTMGTVMTAVFTVMFYNFPSGLNIYWLSSMLLGMLQQWMMSRKMQKQPLPSPLPLKSPGKKAKS